MVCNCYDCNFFTSLGTKIGIDMYYTSLYTNCTAGTDVASTGWMVVNNNITTNATTVLYKYSNVTAAVDYHTTRLFGTVNTINAIQYNHNWHCNVIPPAERLRTILRKRHSISFTTKSLSQTKDIREIRARETLRRVIGEQKFRDFIKKGFVSVKGKSGLIYQIFPGHDFTNIYDRGIMKERLCAYLNGEFPPTDSLIARYLLILNNEDMFRSYSNVHEPIAKIESTKPDKRTLVEIFRELKAA